MKTLKSNKLKLNQVVFFNLLGPVILNGISFFTIPIFTRLLGTDNYGVYTLYSSYQSILVLIMGLQMQSVIAPASVYYEGDERERYLSASFSISLISCVLFSLIIVVLVKPISNITKLPQAMVLLMVLQSVGMTSVQWALARFTYEKKAKINFILSTLIALCGVLLSLLFIQVLLKSAKPYYGYVLGHTIPYAVLGITFFACFLIKRKFFFAKREWTFCLALCLPVVFHSLSNTLLHQADKIMIQSFMDDGVTGIYGFAVSFANVLSIIFNALNVTWVPFYHDDIKENRTDRLKVKTNNYTFLFTCLTVGFIMAMPEVVKLFAQRDFWPSIKVIPILVIGTYFMFLYTFPVNFEFFYKKTKAVAFGTLLACICNIVLNYFLIQRLGMHGAALATMISSALLYLFHLFIAKFRIKEEYHYPYKFFYVYLAIVIASAIIFYLIIDLFIIRWSIFVLAGILLLYRIIKNKSIF